MSITVIVTNDGYPSLEKPFVAHVASNPAMRTQGKTAEEAVDNLKRLIMTQFKSSKGSPPQRVVEITLDEMIVGEVMDE
jgi:predicted RNase H-like HicB family nuclease